MDFDLSTLGWSAEELDELLAPAGNEGLTDPDEIPAPPNEATTKPGDIWVLGNHRLMCGDSAKAEDLDRLLDGARIHLVNTDPPYNVAVEPRSNNAIAAGNSSFSSGQKMHLQKFDKERGAGGKATHAVLRPKDRQLANDALSEVDFDAILLKWFGNIDRVLLPGRAFYIWGGYSNHLNYRLAMRQYELHFAQCIVWWKDHRVLGRKDFMSDHEWSYYGWKRGAAHQFFGPNNIGDVWQVKKVSSQNMVHLTEKPVELAARAISYSSKPGENVLDLFGGSGSTLIACEQHGRRAHLMELDPLYCDVIVQRWQSFAGKKAERCAAAKIQLEQEVTHASDTVH
jgi:DNA modification methylase